MAADLDPRVREMAHRLAVIPGVVGVTLGGSPPSGWSRDVDAVLAGLGQSSAALSAAVARCRRLVDTLDER